MVGRLSHMRRKDATGRAGELLGELRPHATPPIARSRRTRAACGDGSTWPRRSSPARPSSSSTSRRPASTPRAVRTCGASSKDWSPRARRSCSPPSTSKRPTGCAATSWSSTTAGSSPRGRRPQLKATLGTSVVSITLSDDGMAPRAAELVASLSDKRPDRRRRNGGADRGERAQGRRGGPAPLDDAGITLAGLALREPSLDDVFLSLTGHKTEDDRPHRTPAATRAARARAAASPRAGARVVTASARQAGGHHPVTTVSLPVAVRPAPSGGRLRWLFADIATVTWRNLVALTRIPEALFFSTLQPIMFVLLFRYVFGGRHPHSRQRPLRRLHDAGHLRADGPVRLHQHAPSAWPRICTRG